MTRTRNIAESIRKKLRDNQKLADKIEQHAFDAEIASLIYCAREEAKLTQAQLAELVGTRQSVIARLEDWDYSGHSLTMLKRISDALGKRLHIEFRPRFSEFQYTASSNANPSTVLIDDREKWIPTLIYYTTSEMAETSEGACELVS